jgi:hypothetical protein
MKLPTGPGGPAPDATDAVADATSACRTVSTLSAEVAVSGSVGGHGLRGRLLAGLAPPASARLEAVAPFGQPIFIFVSRGGDATLLLPRDNRVLEHGESDKVLEAVAGVPLDAAGLRTALTGCVVAPDADRAIQRGGGSLPPSTIRPRPARREPPGIGAPSTAIFRTACLDPFAS